jgi:hypothetical protein
VNNKHLVVVDRANLDRIRQELGFNVSGEVSDKSMQEIGQMLGAQALVTGSLTSIADLRRLMFKVIMTETAAVTVQHNADIINDRRVQALIAQGGGSQGVAYGGQGNNRGNSGTTTQAVPAQANPTPPTPATPTYRIGDRGPAGGLIFYDKGNNSGGWRYLEAAPAETEKQIPFFPKEIGFSPAGYPYESMMSRLVGDGKNNTELIFEYFVKHGGGFNTAIRYCTDLSMNGFDDWFLPTSDELSWMYGNLYMQGRGNLKDGWYWSSTFAESGYSFVNAKNFSTGEEDTARHNRFLENNSQRVYVRAVRRF